MAYFEKKETEYEKEGTIKVGLIAKKTFILQNNSFKDMS